MCTSVLREHPRSMTSSVPRPVSELEAQWDSPFPYHLLALARSILDKQLNWLLSALYLHHVHKGLSLAQCLYPLS